MSKLAKRAAKAANREANRNWKQQINALRDSGGPWIDNRGRFMRGMSPIPPRPKKKRAK